MTARAHWFAPWAKWASLPYRDACNCKLAWYEQQQILVLFEYAAAKLEIKEAQASYDVHKIDMEKIESVLRKGNGRSKDWGTFVRLKDNIEDDLMHMQEARGQILECRDHMLFLKWRIEEAREEEAQDWIVLEEEEDYDEYLDDEEPVWMDIDDL